MAEAPRIALFGGTFDPVHLGHLEMAGRAMQALKLSEVRFIPCQISPHKGSTPPTPVDQRLEMLRIATRELPWAIVDDVEAKQTGPSYSWQTAQSARDQFPNARLFWIMGTDQWEALSTWTHPERLADCVEFIVFTRNHDPVPRDGYTLHALPLIHPASSSEIRDAIAQGESHHPWLDPMVAEYILQHRYYAGNNPNPREL